MLAKNLKGRCLVATAYKIGRRTKPWMNRPMRTVMKYMPSWPMITEKLSISRSFDDTRNRTPMGDALPTNAHLLREMAVITEVKHRPYR